MKSFLSLFRHFIPALIIVIVARIYLLLQPTKSRVPATVPTSPTVSSASLIPAHPPLPKDTSTPPLQRPYPPTYARKSLPVPSPNQVATGTDAIYEIPPKSLNPPSTARKSITSKLPTHFFYPENTQNLVEIGTYFKRVAYLNWEAAAAFEQMKLAAQKAGIKLTPISGFRSVADQEKLFQKQIKRQGSPQAAQRLSAPPGFSEHHTGYALDISDSRHPETDLKLAFESTEAYRWLEVHASQYGFELSFTKNNLQGVSYEPWHWRFVGSPTAQEIFR